MDRIKFKTRLFGYSKIDVRDYIARMNEDFAKTLMNNLAEQEKKKEVLRDRIAQLEAELDVYKKQCFEVSDAILDAKKYAAHLKGEADKEKAMRELEFSEWDEQQAQKICGYQQDIADIRSRLKQFAANTEMELEQYEEQLEFIKNHCQSRAELKKEDKISEVSETEDISEVPETEAITEVPETEEITETSEKDGISEISEE